MASDIVNRIHQTLWRAPSEYHGLLHAAADEIERLERRVIELNNLLKESYGLTEYWEKESRRG